MSAGKTGYRRPPVSPCSLPPGTPVKDRGHIIASHSTVTIHSYLAIEVPSLLAAKEILISLVGCRSHRSERVWILVTACSK